jgi:hypothetical protein
MGHEVNLFGGTKEPADRIGEDLSSVRHRSEWIGRRRPDMKIGERLLKVASHSIKVLKRPQPLESKNTWHKNDVHRHTGFWESVALALHGIAIILEPNDESTAK